MRRKIPLRPDVLKLDPALERRERPLLAALSKHSARGNFDNLIQAGVPGHLLVECLRLLAHPSLPPDTWTCEARTGLSRREYKKALRAFSASADYLRRIAADGHPAYAALDLDELNRAAELLEILSLADRFEKPLRHFKGRTRNDRAVAVLVKLVLKHAGSAHDGDTSALVQALIKQTPSAEAMKSWRAAHAALVDRTPALPDNPSAR
ncbi:MAG: hypothetical protein ACRD3O_07065 [Terriglobia bacterium]